MDVDRPDDLSGSTLASKVRNDKRKNAVEASIVSEFYFFNLI